MKTTKILAILTAGLICFATLANAQNFELKTSSALATESVDSLQVDFVTVGATMPYSINIAQDNLSAWKTAFQTAGFSNAVTTVTKWFVDADELTGAENQSPIFLKWNVEGAYTLKAQSDITIDNITGSCEPAVSSKTVYVLPAPSAAILTNNQVLSCDATSYIVKYKAIGIGKKEVNYTVTRRPFSGPESTSNDVEEIGVTKGVADADYFTENVTKLADAKAEYDVNNAVSQDFEVSGLEPGYIYTLTFTSVSDQISRKCGVDATTLNTSVSLAVVPKPASTKINHVRNIE